MSDKTAISWTEHTWNPWRGCQKISPGCKNCYMYTAQLKRARQTRDTETWDPFRIIRTTTWRDPLRWQRAAAAAGRTERVFTCSWSDFFIEAADGWRPEAWQIIRECRNLQFQILTKRPENIPGRLPQDWGPGYPNVWLGVSVETQEYADARIPLLLEIPAAIHFLSAEPLLGPIDLRDKDAQSSCLDPYDGDAKVDWVIVGGESGPGYRPMETEWARSLRDQCKAAGVAFFFKQSAAPRTEMGTLLDGIKIQEYPRIGR